MLPFENRLKNPKDIAKVFSSGFYCSNSGISIKYIPNQKSVTRFAFLVGKNYSKKAVERNQAKRVLREAIHKELENIVPGYDVTIFIKTETKPLQLADVHQIIKKILVRAKLLKSFTKK